MSKKILFIASDRVKDSYGITSGLYNSATFVVNYLKNNGFDAKLVSVPDSNSIDKVVTEFNPDIVVIEALWVPPQKFEELFNIKRHLNRKWIVRVHSKAPFLSMESLATKWIGEYCMIRDGFITIAPNTPELTNQLSVVFPFGTFIYLPNIYIIKDFVKNEKKDSLDTIHIGCFGAVRPLKNIYQQALVSIEFAEFIGKKLVFHINASRLEQSGNNVLKNLRALFLFSPHQLVEHGWYTHNEFLEVLGEMDLSMQVSLTESFNIVTADSVTANVPVVVSKDIDWMPFISRATPTSHESIFIKMFLTYKLPKFFSFIQKFYLKKYTNKAQKIWLQFITNE